MTHAKQVQNNPNAFKNYISCKPDYSNYDKYRNQPVEKEAWENGAEFSRYCAQLVGLAA